MSKRRSNYTIRDIDELFKNPAFMEFLNVVKMHRALLLQDVELAPLTDTLERTSVQVIQGKLRENSAILSIIDDFKQEKEAYDAKTTN